MTRRKRTPSPDRSRKRVAFSIPASLAQLSALSRSLAIQDGASQQEGNSDIVARAQALSQSPTADAGWQHEGKQQPKEIRFKHDSRQFPTQQEWPQPTPNQGAVGHARFLEKQWQASQAARVVENMRRERLMQEQIEENRQRSLLMNNPLRGSIAQQTTSSALGLASTPVQNQQSLDFVSEHRREFSDSQQWPNPSPRGGQRPLDLDIEQRRQAIIAKLMESQPASVATSSSNIQIPTNASSQSATHTPEPPADLDAPLDLTTQPNQIAALIERKRAENAANGSLNRFLAARSGHQKLQEEAKKAKSTSTAIVGHSTGLPTSDNPFIFNPHPANLAGQKSVIPSVVNNGKQARVPPQEDDPTKELDLRSLFSSPALSPPNAHSQHHALSQSGESEDASSKDGPTQLPSPSLSSPSQHETHRAPSPSAQLLMNLANAAPAPTIKSSQQPTFRMPPLSVSTHGLTRTSSAARQRPPPTRNSIHVEGPLTAQQQEMRLMQRQTEQQRQEQNLRQFQQHMQATAHNQYPQATAQQSIRRPQSSTSMPSNSSNYYNIKPQLWDAFSTDKFAMSPPSYAQSNTSNVLGSSASGSGGDYAMSSIDALSDTSLYSGPRGAGYGSFTNGGGANASFRMSTQNKFGMQKR